MEMMYGADGYGVLWAIVMLLVWLGLIGGAVALVVHYVRPPSRPVRQPPTALDVLERRYAAGEIGAEEFDEARARLREYRVDP
jgi:putative membrane protein